MALGKTAKRLTSLAEKVEEIYQRLQRMHERVAGLDDRIERIDERMNGLEAQAADQRALLDAVASEHDIDPEAIVADRVVGADGGDEEDVGTASDDEAP